MRLHRLEVEAFGPFAGRTVLDLDEAAATGLFLIHGATGSGKTSLLDAVCFALFADVPGARSRRALRSDHAPPDAVPVVRLELTAGGRRLRIERSPEFHRPKRRGQGLLRVPSRVSLEEFTRGAWTTLSTRADEAAGVVDEVLGLGLAQFAKVVILPQGDFAAFLRASAEERRALLERLFDIASFGDVEAWLAEERRVTTAHADRLRERLNDQLARVEDALAERAVGCGAGAEAVLGLGAAEAAPGDEPGSEQPGSGEPGRSLRERRLAELPGHLDALVQELDTEATAALTAFELADAAQRRAAAALAEGRRMTDAYAKGAAARERLDVLRACHDEHAARVAEIDAASRADRVSGELSACALRRAEVAEADIDVRRAELDAGHTGMAGSNDAILVRVLEELAEHDPCVSGMVSCAAALDAALGKRDALAAEAAQRRDEARAADLSLAGLAERLAVVEGEVDGLTEAAGAVELLRLRTREAESRLDLRRATDSDDDILAELRPRLLEAREATLAARESLLELRALRLTGLAAELAGTLTDGDGCPVCGSCEHPQPARAERSVSQDEIDTAEAELARIRDGEQSLRERVAGVEARRAEREHALGSALGVAALAAQAEQARAALAEARAAAGRLGEIRGRQAQLTAEFSQARSLADSGRVAVARADERLAAAEADVSEAASALGRHVAGHRGCPCTASRGTATRPEGATALQTAEGTPVVAPSEPVAGRPGSEPTTHADVPETVDALAALDAPAVLERHERWVAGLTALATARAGLAVARKRVTTASAALDEALGAAGFADEDAARAATRDGETLAVLRDQVRDHDDAVAATRAVLEDPEVRAALSAGPPDLAALRSAETATREAMHAARADQSGADRRLATARRLVPAVTTTCTELEAAADRAARIRDLADTVAGIGPHNTMRMRLTSFVLAARLERVVALANERLATMGAGRYLLEHSDGRAAAGARSGLGLRVLDQWTGCPRDTASLSGGESFMTSLALALGLADAVREESGGADLGTLFVDEGFGSLDEESLEEVLTVLDSLREGGRAVGVVSHVAELRDRVTHQVLVSKHADGSGAQVRVTGPTAA